MVQLYRPQVTNDNIIRRMRFACCMTVAINTHSQYVILFHCNNGSANALQFRLYLHSLSCFFHRGTENLRANAVIGRCVAVDVVRSTAHSPTLKRNSGLYTRAGGFFGRYVAVQLRAVLRIL